MRCIYCGNECRHFPVLDEILFPVGRVTTDHPCDYCKDCGMVMPDPELAAIREQDYRARIEHLLVKKHLDYGTHPELYVEEMEFEKMTRLAITDKLRNWLEKGFFCKRINGKLHFLRQAVEHYNMTDYGMFPLVSDSEFHNVPDGVLFPIYCHWCFTGDMVPDPEAEPGQYHWKCLKCE